MPESIHDPGLSRPQSPPGLRVAETWLSQIRALGIKPDAATAKRIRRECFWNRRCQDCRAALGQPHELLCGVARCAWTGMTRIGCRRMYDGKVPHDCGRQVWDGVRHGTQEAVDLGLYITDDGPRSCGPAHPSAIPDLKAVYRCAEWDRNLGRFAPGPATLDLLKRRRKREPVIARIDLGAIPGFVPWPPIDAPHESALWASCPGLAAASRAADRA